MNSNSYFGKELRRYYPRKFLIAFAFLVLIILSPLFFLMDQVVFDPAEFLTTYLSSVFTAVLIGVILQIIQLYNTSHANYSKVYDLLQTIQSILEKIEKNLEGENLSIYSDILSHYKISLFNSFISDTEINNKLLIIYSSPELEYIIVSLKNQNEQLGDAKVKPMRTKIALIKEKITNTLTSL